MSPDPALEPLSAASPVLIAGGGVTGRAVLAALRALGVDGNAVRRRPDHPAGSSPTPARRRWIR